MFLIRIVVNGFRKNLKREDMWEVDEAEACQVLTDKLEQEWSKRANEYTKDSNL